ncbi:MAG: IS1380 family transposase [Gammaproteobacteria bacterium]|nr:IS1380 family transposase [Gammaproteobacteria bacterium]
MPKRYHNVIRFTSSGRRRVEAEFTGAEVTANGGAPLLAEADRRLGLTEAAARAMGDDRRRKSVVHSTISIVRQRLHALVLGHEDLNDHGALRRDAALQAAAGRDGELASPSTLCRFERRSSPSEAAALHGVLFDQFVQAHPVPPKRVVLDFDATDILLHGMQAGRHWHGHYRNYCYLPLYVFAGRHLLVAALQPSDRDAAWRAGAVLALLVKALRAEWPGVEVVFRADSGFCRRRILRWCESRGVGYVVGLPSNSVLARLAAPAVEAAAALHRLNGGKQRLFDDFEYAAGAWPRRRRVVVKAEHTGLGPNTRFVVTNLDMADGPQGLYDGMYCERGDMENRIKDQQLGLFADRASSSDFDANQLRLLLSGLAYTLIEGMRRMALEATELAKASPNTIRLTLLKVGAVVLSNTRRVRLLMSRSHPNQALFRRVAAALAAQPP